MHTDFFRLCCWLSCKDGGRRSSFRSDEFCVSVAGTEFAANRRAKLRVQEKWTMLKGTHQASG